MGMWKVLKLHGWVLFHWIVWKVLKKIMSFMLWGCSVVISCQEDVFWGKFHTRVPTVLRLKRNESYHETKGYLWFSDP